VTTPDPIRGRPAATRSRRGVALLCACLAAGATAPVFAMQPVAPAAASPVASRALAGAPAVPTGVAVPVAPTASPAPAPAPAPAAPDEPATMSDRALSLATDINRLIARPDASAPAEAEQGSGNAIQSVLQRALTLLGTPYRWGGTTTAGFDCSGLVRYVFRTTLGIELPRVSREMARSGQQVARAHLAPGDLVFFGRRGRVDHVGIYLGDGRFVHAPRTGRDVTVSSLEGYWGRKFLSARRVAGL